MRTPPAADRGPRPNNPTTNPRAMSATAPTRPPGSPASPGRRPTTSTSPSTSRSRGSTDHRRRQHRRTTAPDHPGAGRHRLRRRTTSPTWTTQQSGLSTTCSKPADHVRRSAGSPRTTAATRTTRSARATTSPGLFDRERAADLPAAARPGVDDAEEPHRRPLRRPTCSCKYYVPMIEKSRGVQGRRADRHHLRRGQPALHTRNSFNNATDDTTVAAEGREADDLPLPQPVRRGTAPDYLTYPAGQFPAPGALATDNLKADRAGQNIDGKNVSWEPTGPNSTLGTDSVRQPALPRPRVQRLHRPPAVLRAGHGARRRGQEQLRRRGQEHRGRRGVQGSQDGHRCGSLRQQHGAGDPLGRPTSAAR